MPDDRVPDEHSRYLLDREIPFSEDAEHIWEGEQWAQPAEGRKRRPSPRHPPPAETDLQALMETSPGHEPRPSVEGSAAMMDALHDVLEQLPPKQAWVVDAHQWRGMTFAEIAEVLSVSRQQAHRLYNQALVNLKTHLVSPPYDRDEEV